MDWSRVSNTRDKKTFVSKRTEREASEDLTWMTTMLCFLRNKKVDETVCNAGVVFEVEDLRKSEVKFDFIGRRCGKMGAPRR